MYDLHDFLEPIHFDSSEEITIYNDGQFAKHIKAYHEELPDLANIDIVLVGIGETRGSGIFNSGTFGPDIIRKQLSALYYWHYDVRIADIGNIRAGATLNDSLSR
ncbi:MAG: hypothetical protein WDM71_11485 [Ferruginibacter sp.]